MSLSLAEAARRTGLSKPTIQRAIKSGKLSASRNDDGSYSIDPAELDRAYPEGARSGDVGGNVKQDETPIETGMLRREVELLRERLGVADLERDRERRQLSDQIEDLKAQRDKWQIQAERLLLTDQRAKPEPEPALPPAAPAAAPPKGLRGWLSRLVG